jgi:predicted dehydrogenase
VRLAIAGCGDVARRYASTIGRYDQLELVGATDLVPEKAAAIVEEFGGRRYETLDELFADDSVDTLVNLTIPVAHAEVTRAALEAGKHVHTEKPVALRYAEAVELAELAAVRGLRLSCAPATLLGEAQQTAWKLLRDGEIDAVRVVYAEANWGRIESWHPSPAGLYASGPLFDVGVYPMTILTGMLGPVRRVIGYETVLEPNRVTKGGEPFRIERPDFVVAVLDFESGVVARLTATFFVEPSKQRGIEWHGEHGSLHLATWDVANSSVELKRDGAEYQPVPLVREPFDGVDWARPIADLADALEAGRLHRMTAEHAAQVVEVLCAIDESARAGRPAEVTSSFVRPVPLEWAA